MGFYKIICFDIKSEMRIFFSDSEKESKATLEIKSTQVFEAYVCTTYF